MVVWFNIRSYMQPNPSGSEKLSILIEHYGKEKASTGRNLSSGSESTSEMQVQTTDQLSTSMSFSMPPPAEPAEQNTEPNVISSAVKKHSLGRKYRSETALDSVKHANSRVNTFLPGRVKKINLPFQIMLDENEEDSHNTTQESFKPIDTKNHTTNGTPGFNNHGHTSGYLSMTSNTCDSKIPMVKEPTKNCIEKKPEMPKPVEIKVQEQPRKPLAPKQLEPETPNNKQIPSVPSTPIPQLRMVTVNDQHYAILGVHGKGGSIEVYQCFDSSNKIVAIKCVNLDNTHEEIIEGYKNEIRLLKRLQYCDQVITMYDSEFKSDENKLYIVMESGRSEDLDSFFRSQMKNKKRLSDNLICCYWKIMVEAVKALHKEGIIHSDLKPANFLLVGGKLKLIDFGIAEALQQDKTSVILDTQIGTLNYTSPETIMDSCWGDESQGKKFKIGVKSDVWSLGCILYNLVYMRTPFQHLKQDFFKVQAIINPDFPIEFPDLPNEHLIDVMKKCLTRDPKERPSVDQLLSHPYLRRGNSSKTDSPQVVKPR